MGWCHPVSLFNFFEQLRALSLAAEESRVLRRDPFSLPILPEGPLFCLPLYTRFGTVSPAFTRPLHSSSCVGGRRLPYRSLFPSTDFLAGLSLCPLL